MTWRWTATGSRAYGGQAATFSATRALPHSLATEEQSETPPWPAGGGPKNGPLERLLIREGTLPTWGRGGADDTSLVNSKNYLVLRLGPELAHF